MCIRHDNMLSRAVPAVTTAVQPGAATNGRTNCMIWEPAHSHPASKQAPWKALAGTWTMHCPWPAQNTPTGTIPGCQPQGHQPIREVHTQQADVCCTEVMVL